MSKSSVGLEVYVVTGLLHLCVIATAQFHTRHGTGNLTEAAFQLPLLLEPTSILYLTWLAGSSLAEEEKLSRLTRLNKFVAGSLVLSWLAGILSL